MSGFEIAGVVLGALPLLIEGVKAYGDGIRTIQSIINYKRIVEDLVVTLESVDSAYWRGYEKLLLHVDLTRNDIEEILESRDINQPKWESARERIRDFFERRRSEHECKHFHELMQTIFRRMSQFAGKLGLKHTNRYMVNKASSIFPCIFCTNSSVGKNVYWL